MPKVYVVMSLNDTHNKITPPLAYRSESDAITAFYNKNLLNAIRFNDYMLITATCTNTQTLADFAYESGISFMEVLNRRPEAPRLSAAQPGLFAAPSQRLTENEIINFLKINSRVLANREANRFITALCQFLPHDFLAKTNAEQCAAILRLRQNQDFMKALLCHWQLACIFMDAAIGNNSDLKSQLLSSGRISLIYHLNNLRRDTIPDHIRSEMNINDQQALVLNTLSAQRARNQPKIGMPDLQAGFITMKIEAEQEAGKIILPNDLICPLTLSLFKDPVVVNENGKKFYFERKYIEEAIKVKAENPLTRAPLSLAQLKPAPEKAKEVAEFKEKFKADMGAALSPSSAPTSSKK